MSLILAIFYRHLIYCRLENFCLLMAQAWCLPSHTILNIWIHSVHSKHLPIDCYKKKDIICKLKITTTNNKKKRKQVSHLWNYILISVWLKRIWVVWYVHTSSDFRPCAQKYARFELAIRNPFFCCIKLIRYLLAFLYNRLMKWLHAWYVLSAQTPVLTSQLLGQMSFAW